MPAKRAKDPAAMLRAHVAAVVTAVQAFEEARQQVASSAMALSDLLELPDSPLCGSQLLSADADTDIESRARFIASIVVGDAFTELDVPGLVDDALELQALVEFFLTRATEQAA